MNVAAEALLRGALGYVAQEFIKSAKRRLESSQNKPPNWGSDGRRSPSASRRRDEEEILGDFLEQCAEYIDVRDLTIEKSIEIIGLRFKTNVAFSRLTIVKLTGKGHSEGGPGGA